MSPSDATAQANADGAASKRRLGIGFWIAVSWLAVIFLAALFAPWLPFKDPDANFIQSGERPPYPPSTTHPFGTDQDARDMLDKTATLSRKVKEAQRAQRQREREFKNTTDLLGKLKKVSGF